MRYGPCHLLQSLLLDKKEKKQASYRWTSASSWYLASRSLIFSTNCSTPLLLWVVEGRDVPIRFFSPQVRIQVIWFWVSADTETRSDTYVTHYRNKEEQKTDPGCCLFLISFTLFYHLTLLKGVLLWGSLNNQVITNKIHSSHWSLVQQYILNKNLSYKNEQQLNLKYPVPDHFMGHSLVACPFADNRKQHNAWKRQRRKTCSVSGHVFFLDCKRINELDPAFIWNQRLFIKIYTCTGV